MTVFELLYTPAPAPPGELLYQLAALPEELLYQFPAGVPEELLYQLRAVPEELLYQFPDVVVPTGSDLTVTCAIDGSGATLTLAVVADAAPGVSVTGRAGQQPTSVVFDDGVATITAVVTGDDVYSVLVQAEDGTVLYNAPVAVLCAGYQCFREENRRVAVPGLVTPRWRGLLARLFVIPAMTATGNVAGAQAQIDALALTCSQDPDCGCP